MAYHPTIGQSSSRAQAEYMVSLPASVLRDIRKALECANAHGELTLLDKALATSKLVVPPSGTDIQIDSKTGTLPLTALIDAGNQLLRMSKDGQRVVIKHHATALILSITLTRVAMGNFTESYSAELVTARK